MEDKNYSEKDLSELIKWLKVIGEPKRIRLLEKIIEGVQCNCELGSSLQMAANLTSHHLSILKDSGLINSERDPIDGRWIYYSINLQAMQDMKSALNSFFDEKRIQPRNSTCGPKPDGKEVSAELKI
ncbi:MAG: winged helix-turn-helix transcriptional regulator [Anaerolineaceae bacterium]|nr:winged helix-turn-helix transcriptional regulator [Anaerolineaceae bacterium]